MSYLIPMATLINTVCYQWKRGTENTVCLSVSETMGNRHAVWLQSHIPCPHPQGFFRCIWSRSSCFLQTLTLAIDSLRWLFYEVKRNGNLYLALWLNYPPLENFCQIPGLHILPTGQKSCVFCHVAITTPGRQRRGLCFESYKRSCILH